MTDSAIRSLTTQRRWSNKAGGCPRSSQDEHVLKIFADSFMISMRSFSLRHPFVIWCNGPHVSCANISVRMDSGPSMISMQAVKPPNLCRHPPTCCHIWDALYTNTRWLIPVQEKGSTHVSLYLYTLCTAPDPALGNATAPLILISLMLFGMCCRATVSVNTAPGNSDRKPLRLCGKLDAITECTPICSDNSISASELSLSLCHSPFFCF